MTTVLHTMGDNATFFFLLKEIQVDTARRIQIFKLLESSHQTEAGMLVTLI